MENKESLEASTVIRKAPNFIKNDVNLLFANGVMTPRIYQTPSKTCHFKIRVNVPAHSCSRHPPSQ
jgi:hypothetical protein